MAGKGFDFFRLVEEVIKIAEEAAAPPREEDSEQPRDKAASRKQSGPTAEPLIDLGQIAGLAAAGIAAFAHHTMHKNSAAGAEARQRKDEQKVREAFRKSLIEQFNRHAAEAGRSLRSVRQGVHERLSKKENIVKNRADVLAVDPSQEQLLDALEAQRFFDKARSDLATARNRAQQQVSTIIPGLRQAYADKYGDDPSFDKALDQALKIWEQQRDSEAASMSRRLETLEAALANIRTAATRVSEQTDQVFAAHRLLFMPSGRPLNAADLETLTARMLQPRDARLAALFEDLIAKRITGAELDQALAELAWNGTALADIIERAVLASSVFWYFRLHIPQETRQIERFGKFCTTALWGNKLQDIPLEGEDAVRIAAALIADFESRSPLVNVISWRKLGPLISRMPDKLRGYLTREEARALLERIEGPALLAMEDRPHNPARGKVFAPYAALMRDLAEIARIGRPVPALEKWELVLAQRQAARAKVMAAASPFWQPLLAAVLDAERCDPRIHDATERKVYDLLRGFGALSESQLAVVAEEVDVIMGDRVGLCLASRDDGWLTAAGGAIAERALSDLRQALAKAPEQRAAFFAPLAAVTGLGDFAPMFEAQEWRGGNPVLEGEIGDLLAAARVEEAELRLRDWLTKAPNHPLRTAVLATSVDRLVLTGWESFADLARDPEVGALTADFSGHCVSSLLDAGGEILWFEDGTIATHNYDFALHPLEEMRRIGRSYPRPWQGCTDYSGDLRLKGIAPVLQALRKERALKRPDTTSEHDRLQKVMTDMTETWCFAAFAVTVRRRALAAPPPRAIPVILGTHDFGWRIPDVIF